MIVSFKNRKKKKLNTAGSEGDLALEHVLRRVKKHNRCFDREGNFIRLHSKQTLLFRLLLHCSAGKMLIHGFTRPNVTKLVGSFMESRASKMLIKPFVRRNGIDMSEYEPGPFKSFDAFFCRKIISDARNIDKTPLSVISPCDGKIQVYPINEDTHFEIKGIPYSCGSLLRDRKLAEMYSGGTLMLLRLSVDDYHHYVYPINGNANEPVRIDGRYHTVHPYVASHRPIYRENAREYSLIETENVGNVLMMEVGAMMVGKIINTHPSGRVTRGEEKGYFKFGASSIVLCFEKGMITPDPDLIKNSAVGAETIVKLGEHIADTVTAGE